MKDVAKRKKERKKERFFISFRKKKIERRNIKQNAK